jgi:dihydrofolate reductase
VSATARDPALVLVAAIAENGVIGHCGRLPWHLKSDLKHFRRITFGHPVLMGRKTFLALPAALPGRTNIVLSRDSAFAAPGILTASSLESALAAGRGDALRRGVGAIMVIGGGDLFTQLIDGAARLEITRVHARVEGDVGFPPIDPARWSETSQRHYPAGPGDEAPFTISTFELRLPTGHKNVSR